MQKIILIILLIPSITLGAFDSPTRSVGSFSMAGAVDLANSAPLDIFCNPALQLKDLQLDLSWSRLYQMDDFENSAAAISYSFPFVSSTMGISQLGNSDYYMESSYLLALSKAVQKRLRIGLAAKYLQIEYGEGYSSLSAMSFSAGVLFRVSDKIITGLSIQNINSPKFDPDANSLPLIAELSATYSFSSKLKFFFTYHLEEKVTDRFIIGQKIKILENIEFMLGLASDPTEIGTGLSFKIGYFYFDYGFRDNVYLGGTHKIGLRLVK